MNKLNLVREILLRIQHDSPEFFGKLQRYSIWLMCAAFIPIGLNWAEVLHLSDVTEAKMWAVIAFFAGSGGTATLPVKDTSKIDNNDQTNENV